jgi:hypothetical protein
MVLMLVLLTGCSGSRPPQHDEVAGTPAVSRRADELAHTVVTPHLDWPLGEGENVLWCATFQIAWNELSSLAGGDIHMVNEDAAVRILNWKAVTASDLDDTTYVAAAGIAGSGVVARIRTDLARKFSGAASPKLLPDEASLVPGTALAYAYLYVALPFQWAFKRHTGPLRFRDVPVESFGISEYLIRQESKARAASQVWVYDGPAPDEFVVELKTRMPKHRLLLACLPPRSSLGETVEAVQAWVASTQPRSLREGTWLAVPVLDFDVIRDYVELMGKPLDVPNRQLNGQFIGAARQDIRFRLDERGAVLKSEAELRTLGVGMNLSFNRPFLIMLQYDDTQVPYFALWIDNTELLVPFTPRPQLKGRR